MDAVDLPHSDQGPRSGIPIILLHGYPLDHRMWRFQAKPLADAGYRVLVPDLRGFGRAPAGRGAATMEAHVADVLRMADRAGLRKFVLGGFSLGGYVALDLARRAPERLAGLMLVDTRAEADSEETRVGRASSAERIRREGMAHVAEGMLPKLLTPRADPTLAQEVRGMMLAAPPEGAVAALHAMAQRPDQRAALPAFRVPTLVMVGAEDPVTPPEAARAMSEAIPGATLRVIEGAAHLAPMERPQATLDAMLAWLRA